MPIDLEDSIVESHPSCSQGEILEQGENGRQFLILWWRRGLAPFFCAKNHIIFRERPAVLAGWHSRFDLQFFYELIKLVALGI